MLQMNRFIEMLRNAASEDDIGSILEEFTYWLGFERFAIGHHVDLARPPRNAFRATNYDPAWISQMIERRFFVDDPIHAASIGRVTGLHWDELDRPSMPERQRLILSEARCYGLVTGYTVPVSLPGEYAGTCSFAGRSRERVCPLTLTFSDIVVLAAFERIRILMERRDGRPRRIVPKLPQREREALILVGRGKSDGEIGDIMGISSKTAHSYVENVRRAYGYMPRPSLTIRAVFDNQFSFADAFWR